MTGAAVRPTKAAIDLIANALSNIVLWRHNRAAAAAIALHCCVRFGERRARTWGDVLFQVRERTVAAPVNGIHCSRFSMKSVSGAREVGNSRKHINFDHYVTS